MEKQRGKGEIGTKGVPCSELKLCPGKGEVIKREGKEEGEIKKIRR
jgi:hypothetical protein